MYCLTAMKEENTRQNHHGGNEAITDAHTLSMYPQLLFRIEKKHENRKERMMIH